MKHSLFATGLCALALWAGHAATPVRGQALAQAQDLPWAPPEPRSLYSAAQTDRQAEPQACRRSLAAPQAQTLPPTDASSQDCARELKTHLQALSDMAFIEP